MTIDRTPAGIDRQCCECEQTFKGEPWMDYCAECHAEQERTSVLRDRWACLTCSTTFEAGKLLAGQHGLKCPNCKNYDVSPAQGSRDIPEYHGEIGTKN